MKILHITPHLGGGIGKAHAALNRVLSGYVNQTFLLLEPPINLRYVDAIHRTGTSVVVAEGLGHVAKLAQLADIVQFEYINHPRVLECLARTEFPPIKSIIWAHNSGLFKPYIPQGLLEQVHRFVFSSKASLNAPSVMPDRGNLAVINSGFGFTENIQHLLVDNEKKRIGYLGTVNFVKMHPGFFRAIDNLPFEVEAAIWGAADPSVVEYAKSMKHPERFIFHGETSEPEAALASCDIFFYPLQPQHYGTGENSLIEAMSIGLPVVVLNNPAEMQIVTNGETGFVEGSIAQCVIRLRALCRNVTLRRLVGSRAYQHVNATRTANWAALELKSLWDAVMKEAPAQPDFKSSIGDTPIDWFFSTQFLPGQVRQIEKQSEGAIKGSLAHFQKVFAGDTSFSQLGLASNH